MNAAAAGSIVIAVILAILMSIAPQEASARGRLTLYTAWSGVSRAETGTARGVQYVWRPGPSSRIHPVSHAIVRQGAH
jgi:hypothetical protein